MCETGVGESLKIRDRAIQATVQLQHKKCETDWVPTRSIDTQCGPLFKSKSSQTECPEYDFLAKQQEIYMRIGQQICSLKPSTFPKLETQKHLKNSGTEIMRNVAKVVESIRDTLGSDSRYTMFDNLAVATSQFCGIDRNTVLRRTPERSLPPRKQLRDMGKKEKCRKYVGQLSLLNRSRIIGHIHQLWKGKQSVTVTGVWTWAKETIEFKKSQSIFLQIIKGLGFTYRANDHNSIITERPDIIYRRSVYLTQKKDWDDKNAFYGSYDETWAFNGMSKKVAWQHSNAGMYKRAKLADMETSQAGPEKARDKGKRFIVAAVLTESGILPGSELLILSGEREEDQLSDYHSDMNGRNFEKYYRKMIPLFAAEAKKQGRPGVILVDNAPYHNATLEKPPTSASSIGELKKFLDKQNLKYFRGQTRDVLYDLAKDFIENNGGREAFTKYKFDEFARSHGVVVLRLPQYHCFFNAVEYFWAQMKGHLRRVGSTSDRVEIVYDRAKEFLQKFPANSAKKLFDHTRRAEEDIREMTEERNLALLDESFELRYDVDDQGHQYNIRIDSDESFDESSEDVEIFPTDDSDSGESSDDGDYSFSDDV